MSRMVCLVMAFLCLGAMVYGAGWFPYFKATWTGAGDGVSWADPANWDSYAQIDTDCDSYVYNWDPFGSTVPDPNYVAEFTGSATFAPAVSIAGEPNDIIMGLLVNGGATLELGAGQSVEVIGNSSNNGIANVGVGFYGQGTLNVYDGAELIAGTSGSGSASCPAGTVDGKTRILMGRGIYTQPAGGSKGTINQYGGLVHVVDKDLNVGDVAWGECRRLKRQGTGAGGSNDCGADMTDLEKQAAGEAGAGTSYNLYGGELIVNEQLYVGKSGYAYGIVNVYGGKLTVEERDLLIYYDGEVNVYGGVLDLGRFGTRWKQGKTGGGGKNFTFDLKGCAVASDWKCWDFDLDEDADGSKVPSDVTFILPADPSPDGSISTSTDIYKALKSQNSRFSTATTIHVDTDGDAVLNAAVGDSWIVLLADDEMTGFGDATFVNDNPNFTFSGAVVDMNTINPNFSGKGLQITLDAIHVVDCRGVKNTGGLSAGDITEDCAVNLDDVAALSADWLVTKP